MIEKNLKKGKTKMIKCPNCGSTAQVECVWNDTENYTSEIYKEYICGCGCHFLAIFEIKKIKILEKSIDN